MLLVCKILLTPLLIALATLAARRWGPVIGGWVVSLPLTSAPISVFLALEHGRGFAAESAEATLLGIVAVTAFSAAYGRAADSLRWPGALLVSLAAYAVIIVSLYALPPPLALACPAIFLWLLLLTLLSRGREGPARLMAAPAWDLPFRMTAATLMALAVTGLSGYLGPRWSGFLSGFPVFVCVMSVFFHGLYGGKAAAQFERGVLEGSYGFSVFFLVVRLMAPGHGLPLVYGLACLAALAANMAVFFLLRRTRRSPS